MHHIYLENDDLLICPVDQTALLNYQRLTKDIFQLLSDHKTLQFLPEKRLFSLAEAEHWLGTTLMNMYCGRNQTHLILSKQTERLLGIIDLIPPRVAQEYYQLPEYPYFLEFYLNKSACGQLLMSNLLPQVVELLKARGIEQIAAVVNRKNLAACKVLSRSGFLNKCYFDCQQDMYLVSA
ncbi:GNAT family N-acetyltransferase [Mucilaginibacter sp. PAMB04274]|uniref:GNAT family N-acetyltransferase n=1 Tax=Mucilaginibacter sp. PAMB04274 TaxID=3138568 RepID=UPI0031F641AC